ncbi:MAG: quinolinate synthase NadA [Bacteroidales bacterium]|nr:quinolinate synthase NadA [Bacteroidales bacterium]
MQKNEVLKKGFIDLPIPSNINLIEEIKRLKKEKNAVILGHFYQEPEIQDLSDYLGDSLYLAQIAEKIDNPLIVFAGVHFMAETAKMLSPDKKVIIPDLNAGCSLADSCPADKFAEFIKNNPNHTVISYVNTTAEIKALSDICCTSTNAVQIVESVAKDEKIIFGPDRNLGNYINSITGRNMLVWDGACHVHEEFSLEAIVKLKKENPDSKIIAHPECEKPILIVADHVGSTSSLLKFTKTDSCKKFIVVTESGILHQMKKESPEKTFIPAPPKDSTCGCNDCKFMRMITLEKIYFSLLYEFPTVDMSPELIKRAVLPIKRMLEISKKLGL